MMMGYKNNGGPAFPVNFDASDNGMSLRDWFAGQMLAGWCANPNVLIDPKKSPRTAYKLADAMIEARK